VLGTKDYWDSAYQKELSNFTEIGDEGTVWFGRDALRRVGKWLADQNFEKENSLVLDLGSGNGSTLLSLASSGWRRLTGVDYSRGAVQLAASIARRKVEDGWLKGFHVIELTGDEDKTVEAGAVPDVAATNRLLAAAPSHDASQCPYISYAVFDITIPLLHSSAPPLPRFDLILDKGTFDAISLCPEEAEEKKRFYIDFVKTALKRTSSDGGGGVEGVGVFCLTSCNWTEEELVRMFDPYFDLKDRIEFPSFQFGGKTGSTVTSLVFVVKKS